MLQRVDRRLDKRHFVGRPYAIDNGIGNQLVGIDNHMFDAFAMPCIDNMHEAVGRLNYRGIGILLLGLNNVIENQGGFPVHAVMAQSQIDDAAPLGEDARQSPYYVRLVNDRAFERVAGYIQQGKVLVGGHTDAAERYIEPTLLAEVDPAAPVMQEEIFGPVLPMLTFERIDEAAAFITGREKPLALYYFGPEKKGQEVLRRTSSGGSCLNDTIMHIANDRMPFGGVGGSGMGRYHGRESFDAFSHRRAVLSSPKGFDLPFRYPPYKGFRWVDKIL